MELQAILDASDSESSQEDAAMNASELPSFTKTQQQQQNHQHQRSIAMKKERNHRAEEEHSEVDLERILREHDDEDDDDNIAYPFGIPGGPIPPLHQFDYNADDNSSLGGTTISTRPYLFGPQTPPSRLARKSHAVNMNMGYDNPKQEERMVQMREHAGEGGIITPTASPSKRSEVYDMPRLRTSLTSPTKKQINNSTRRDRTSESSPLPSNNATSQSRTETRGMPRNNQNPEEWAMLQQILNEADEDDDDEQDYENFNMTNHAKAPPGPYPSKAKPERMPREFQFGELQRAQSNASSTMDVDAIINSIESDSDDDAADLAELDDMIARFSLNVNNTNAERKTRTAIPTKPNSNWSKIDGNLWQSTGVETKKSYESTGTGTGIGDKYTPKYLESNAGKEAETSLLNQSHESDSTWTTSKATSVNKYLHHYQTLTQSKSNDATEAAFKAAEEYERRLLRPGQRDIVSPLMVKRRMKPKIELQTKSRTRTQQQTAASKKKSSGLNSSQHPRFNFSGMIESKCMQRISAELQRSIQHQSEDVGLPTALSIGSKFIAVGTQRGVVLVFDLFEELRQQLGLGEGQNSADVSTLDQYGSVSSIDLASNGETLIAGYTNGTVILWDVIKGTMMKAVSDFHPSPITIVRFISEKSLSAVSVDAGGLVNKLTFVKTLLWSTYNVENECLLDGTAGQILAMDVLAPMSSLKTLPLCITDDKKQPYHPSIHKLVLIALSSERSSFAIAVEPSVSVLHRWARPSNEQVNVSSYLADASVDNNDNSRPGSSPPSVFLPCLSWGWALVSGGENSVTPILARAWGCYIQLLRANFPPSDNVDDGRADDTMHWPAFGVHDEFDVTAPVVALEWLGDRSLVFLSLTNELTIVDTVMMTLTERLDFSGMKLVYAEFALSRPAISQSAENPNNEPCVSTTFQNSIRSSEDRLLVLCQKEVKTLSILGIQQRITALEEDGEWLEALALALDHYEFTIKSQEDRRRNPNGSKDISNHPEFVSRIRLTEDEEWIAHLLLRYLTLAVDNAPESSLDTPKRQNRIDLAQSHYQMLAGVCIEFCIIASRLDLLFNEIYQCFRSAGYTAVFLDVLEPYVLNDKLKYIAPVVMSQFVEQNDIATVERCLLHMDVTIMDFDSILTLLRKNSMFSALIHVYTQGLDDYLSPLQILFDAFFDAADLGDVQAGKKSSPMQYSAFERYGYKILLYLRHCFTKKTFPTGKDLLPEDRITTLRHELLRLLLRKGYQSSTRAKSSDTALESCRKKQYPYIHLIMSLDSKAFLDTLSIVFDDSDVRFVETADNQDTVQDWQNVATQDLNTNNNESGICPDRMDFVRIMSLVLSNDGTSGHLRGTASTDSLDSYYDFMAKYLLKGVIRAPPSVLCGVIARMASMSAQDEIIRLLQVLPRTSYRREDILNVVEGSQISRAALILHKGGVSELFDGSTDSATCSNHFMSAIDCYLKDEDAKFQREVFDYIKNECIGGSTAIVSYGRNRNEETTAHDVLRNALCKKLPALINLDPVPCAQLVAEIYVEELEQILASLEAANDEMVQFKFFNAIISGKLTKADAVAGPVLLANLTIDHHQKYLELMAKFHPDMVYHHLISSDNYRVEECLKLCQEYEIADASAYLLERMGNVSSALQLMLQTLEGRLMTLKRVVRGLSISSYGTGRLKFGRNKLDTHKMVTALHQEKESQAVRQILTFGLDLCERNSGASSNSEHGSQLWFNVLDRLINAKGFLRLSKELPEHSAIMLNVLSDLLGMTMQRMVSNVPLPDLVRKITTDHAGNRLGEFREMITTMLKTYVSEMNVCSGAVDAMQHDVHQMSVTKFNLKVRYVEFVNWSNVLWYTLFE